MKPELPGNLSEIFPLRLRMREELRFNPSEEHVIALRPSSGKRYSLKPWQYVMMCRFDGEKTFEQLGREIYNEFSGLITARGLLNFYTWLYDESLVLCEFASVFELVAQEDEPNSGFQLPGVINRLVSHPKVPTVAMTAVAILFCLAVVRIAFVAAPIFEPPVDRFYAEMNERFYDPSDVPTLERQAVAVVTEPVVELIEPAARVEGIPELSALVPDPEESAETVPVRAESETDLLLDRMEILRQTMAGCRIRRDEFYLQNNEDGYRAEVEKMTELAKEIGEIGVKL